MSTMTSQFEVPGITCGHCKDSIEGALSPMEGVHDATVSIADKTVTVSHDSERISAARLVEAIEDQGYDATTRAQEVTG